VWESASAHGAQKVHSNEQMCELAVSAWRSAPQRSQSGRMAGIG
jgi:hypothetical protein